MNAFYGISNMMADFSHLPIADNSNFNHDLIH
jgi:hypothetical protein